jgi:hypothetical protein
VDWFRVYSSILDKPNVCGLDAETLGYWMLFLAVANRNRPRGSITNNAEDLAWSIHKDAVAVERALQVLINAGLLVKHGDVLRFHKWDQFQPPSTERANASRDTKRQQSATDCNTEQQSATPATQEENRREEKIQNARVTGAHAHEDDPDPELPISQASPVERSAEDAAKIEEAISILAGRMETEPVSRELHRLRFSQEIADLSGWQILETANEHAAGTVKPSSKSVPAQWKFFIRVAESKTAPRANGARASPRPGKEQRVRDSFASIQPNQLPDM